MSLNVTVHKRGPYKRCLTDPDCLFLGKPGTTGDMQLLKAMIVGPKIMVSHAQMKGVMRSKTTWS